MHVNPGPEGPLVLDGVGLGGVGGVNTAVLHGGRGRGWGRGWLLFGVVDAGGVYFNGGGQVVQRIVVGASTHAAQKHTVKLRGRVGKKGAGTQKKRRSR